jgi:hypothetical protein
LNQSEVLENQLMLAVILEVEEEARISCSLIASIDDEQ